MELSQFEHALIRRFIRGESYGMATLRKQLDVAEVESRNQTGQNVRTLFAIDDVADVLPIKIPLSVTVLIRCDTLGLCRCQLLIENGRISKLVISTLANSETPFSQSEMTSHDYVIPYSSGEQLLKNETSELFGELWRIDSKSDSMISYSIQEFRPLSSSLLPLELRLLDDIVTTYPALFPRNPSGCQVSGRSYTVVGTYTKFGNLDCESNSEYQYPLRLEGGIVQFLSSMREEDRLAGSTLVIRENGSATLEVFSYGSFFPDPESIPADDVAICRDS